MQFKSLYFCWRFIVEALSFILFSWGRWNELRWGKFNNLAKILVEGRICLLLYAIGTSKKLILRHYGAAALARARNWGSPVSISLNFWIECFTMIHIVWFKLRSRGLVVRAARRYLEFPLWRGPALRWLLRPTFLSWYRCLQGHHNLPGLIISQLLLSNWWYRFRYCCFIERRLNSWMLSDRNFFVNFESLFDIFAWISGGRETISCSFGCCIRWLALNFGGVELLFCH